MWSRIWPILLGLFILGLVLASLLLSRRDFSDRVFDEPPPADLAAISIVEKLDTPIPLDLAFTDDTGRGVTLADYFDGDKPVILNLVYYRCPSLCNGLLNSLTSTLNDLEWSAGKEFDVLTVSIDPRETAELASNKKRNYLIGYDRPSAADGWHFLVGEQEEIDRLARAVGFGYRWEEGTGQYSHSAGIMICTPRGRVARYLLGLIYEPETARLALVEASQGGIGTRAEHALLRFCYTYDPTSGTYVVAARKVMTIGGAVALLLTMTGLGLLWRREIRAKDAPPPPPTPTTPPLAGVQP